MRLPKSITATLTSIKMNSLSLPSKQPTKGELREAAISLSKQQENPLLAYVQCQRIKDLATAMQAELKAVLIEKLDEPKEIEGVSVSPQSGRMTYTYDHCAAWVEANERLQAIEGMMRSACKPGAIVIDEETGEQMPPARRKIGSPYLKTKY